MIRTSIRYTNIPEETWALCLDQSQATDPSMLVPQTQINPSPSQVDVAHVTLPAGGKQVVRPLHVAVGDESAIAAAGGASERVGVVGLERGLHVHLVVAHGALVVGGLHGKEAARAPLLGLHVGGRRSRLCSESIVERRDVELVGCVEADVVAQELRLVVVERG